MPEETTKPFTGPNPWLVFVAGPIVAFLASYAGVQATVTELKVEVRAITASSAANEARLTQRLRDMEEARIRLESNNRATDLALAQVQERINALREAIIAVDRRAQENDQQLMAILRQIQERLANLRPLVENTEIDYDKPPRVSHYHFQRNLHLDCATWQGCD